MSDEGLVSHRLNAVVERLRIGVEKLGESTPAGKPQSPPVDTSSMDRCEEMDARSLEIEKLKSGLDQKLEKFEQDKRAFEASVARFEAERALEESTSNAAHLDRDESVLDLKAQVNKKTSEIEGLQQSIEKLNLSLREQANENQSLKEWLQSQRANLEKTRIQVNALGRNLEKLRENLGQSSNIGELNDLVLAELAMLKQLREAEAFELKLVLSELHEFISHNEGM